MVSRWGNVRPDNLHDSSAWGMRARCGRIALDCRSPASKARKLLLPPPTTRLGNLGASKKSSALLANDPVARSRRSRITLFEMGLRNRRRDPDATLDDITRRGDNEDARTARRVFGARPLADVILLRPARRREPRGRGVGRPQDRQGP